MLMVISPAKKLGFDALGRVDKVTHPRFLDESQLLVDQLKLKAPHELSSLMSISDDLGQLNFDRYQQWQQPFTEKNAIAAMRIFMGDVYQGLAADKFTEDENAFAQDHLRILSGLYGVLRPLDLIQAYRLEMGTRLENSRGASLYAFWGDLITESLNRDVAEVDATVLLNLASNEYFKSVKKAKLTVPLLTVNFKDQKNGQYKVISFYAKKARGMMANYVIRNGITDPQVLKQANIDGYEFNAELSKQWDWVFTRDHA